MVSLSSSSLWRPELLAPAKNLERLQVAIAYGADAVYVGGPRYGLRARADNFNDRDLMAGVAFAREHGAQVYVTLNAFLHDEDLVGLADYGRFLAAIGVKAAIVSDLGVIRMLQRACPDLDIHLSTQASCLNVSAARVWQQAGVQRIIAGRELSIAAAGTLQQQAAIDVELFVHGAMCMAYSGHCTISNFTAGRDSNRGGCIQSCRVPYFVTPDAVTSETQPAPTLATFMSSKDLWGIGLIGHFFEHRIASLKIEGRMKSAFYVAMTVKAYRQALDAYATGQWTPALQAQLAADLRSIPHREYFTGSLATPAGPDSIFGQLGGINTGEATYVGIVIDTTPDWIVLRLAEPLHLGDEIEIIPFQGPPIPWRVTRLLSVQGEPRSEMRQDGVVCLPKVDCPGPVATIARYMIVRFRTRDWSLGDGTPEAPVGDWCDRPLLAPTH
ncbi:U32 family peptidase [Trichothermofontia sichuanensis B231]|uniref:U32 family peptidase n=1 Tax=Trichothermofontia sichuanensis TaxID=3045816 RepID=UPI0022483133|nr:U32 family peptidase [Trichothermofontia sichuanensis]UZQ55241.1 U32 family peptidase [Trichothermofontia sichuanensis B231]